MLNFSTPELTLGGVMEQLLLVGLWDRLFHRVASVLGVRVEFTTSLAEWDTDGKPVAVWAHWIFSRIALASPKVSECHEVSLVFRPGEAYLWADGAEMIDEQGEPAPWKVATIAEIIAALGSLPRGTLTQQDCDTLERAHRNFQGKENGFPIPPPKMLAEIRRQIERDTHFAALAAEEAREDRRWVGVLQS